MMVQIKLNKGKLGALQKEMREKTESLRHVRSEIVIERPLDPDKKMVISCKAETDIFDNNPRTRTKVPEPCRVTVVSTKDPTQAPLDDKELGVLFFNDATEEESD